MVIDKANHIRAAFVGSNLAKVSLLMRTNIALHVCEGDALKVMDFGGKKVPVNGHNASRVPFELAG